MTDPDPLTPGRRALVRRLSGRVWAAMREELGTTGNVPAPTLYVCSDEAIVWFRCRRFRRGQDAELAISGMIMAPLPPAAWADFWVWERNDLSVALSGSPAAPALQSFWHVFSGEKRLGSQPFELTGAPSTLFMRNTTESEVRTTADLPPVLGETMLASRPPNADDALKVIGDLGYVSELSGPRLPSRRLEERGRGARADEGTSGLAYIPSGYGAFMFAGHRPTSSAKAWPVNASTSAWTGT